MASFKCANSIGCFGCVVDSAGQCPVQCAGQCPVQCADVEECVVKNVSEYNVSEYNVPEYNENGYLEIIKGPMFSGKTNRLINIQRAFAEHYPEYGTMVINHTNDDRYGASDLSSHDMQKTPCVRVRELGELIHFGTYGEIDDGTNENIAAFIGCRVIFINEGQFFDDITEWVATVVEKYNKNVYVCGLNCDYRRQKYGNWVDLESICDSIVMLRSECKRCKDKNVNNINNNINNINNNAIFSHRITGEKGRDVIGYNNYIPVCRKCYHELNNL